MYNYITQGKTISVLRTDILCDISNTYTIIKNSSARMLDINRIWKEL